MRLLLFSFSLCLTCWGQGYNYANLPFLGAGSDLPNPLPSYWWYSIDVPINGVVTNWPDRIQGVILTNLLANCPTNTANGVFIYQNHFLTNSPITISTNYTILIYTDQTIPLSYQSLIGAFTGYINSSGILDWSLGLYFGGGNNAILGLGVFDPVSCGNNGISVTLPLIGEMLDYGLVSSNGFQYGYIAGTNAASPIACSAFAGGLGGSPGSVQLINFIGQAPGTGNWIVGPVRHIMYFNRNLLPNELTSLHLFLVTH